MRSQYRNNANIGVITGLLLHLAAAVIPWVGLGLFSPVAYLVGSGFLIWGLCNYALGKGYPWPLGLLGFFSCIGLIILIVLPDRS